jgi:hypothetical protein
MLPSLPVHIANLPAALPEEFGPQELATDSRRSSAKPPVEQAPSGIAEPAAVTAYALGKICCTAGATSIAVASAAANVAMVIVKVSAKIVFFAFTIFLTVSFEEKAANMRLVCKFYLFIEVISYHFKHDYKAK